MWHEVFNDLQLFEEWIFDIEWFLREYRFILWDTLYNTLISSFDNTFGPCQSY